MTLYEDLKYRNLIKDFSSEEEIKKMLSTPQVIYCGFDPSAASMHMGNFVMVMTLMRLQQAGHKIIAVVGGATGMIGDPSGRTSERQLLDEKEIALNTEKIREQLERYLEFNDKNKGEIVNNYDWLSKISLLSYLRDYGKHFGINYMLAKDTVKSRLETGISYTEFSYMVLQSIDFLHLHENYGVTMQIGGSDQWGNLVSGLDLIRRVNGERTNVEVMTAHLLTDSQGDKFGKSVDGALFIDKEKFSPYALYQYFINVSDEDALKYLKVLTFLSKEEIEALNQEHLEAAHKRQAQKRLAYEVVKIVHNEKEAVTAIKMSEALFTGDFETLTKSNLAELFDKLAAPLAVNVKLEDALITLGAAKSKREAREFINGNAISLNGVKVNDPELLLSEKYFLHATYAVIKRGRRNYYVGKKT
ncbi:MAG TPA: tyrosine--tRNA ligase [Bacilli bacterium]|nr:tyrosine--tRNA ligase [Bacilli bacterium]